MASQDLASLKPVYLIWGGESVLLDRAVDRLRSRLAAVADLDFNLDVFDGGDRRPPTTSSPPPTRCRSCPSAAS